MALYPTALRRQDAARWRAAGEWGVESLGGAFARTCAMRGTAAALIDGERRLAFAEWDRLSAAAADGLGGLGVGAGDVVAYQLPNWWEATVLFLAAARRGAVVNPVLPIFRARELAFILRQSGARVLVVPGTYRDCDYPAMVADLRAELPALRHVLVARAAPPVGTGALDSLWAHPAANASAAVEVDPSTPLMLMYTSGTTAAAKGVLHTHDTLLAEVRSLRRVHALTPGDRTLMPSPLTHISGVVHAILTPAVVGTSAVLMDRWGAAAALQTIARERVTYMVGAPTFLQDLVAQAEEVDGDTTSLPAAGRRCPRRSSGALAPASAVSPSGSTAPPSSPPSPAPTRRMPPRWGPRPRAVPSRRARCASPTPAVAPCRPARRARCRRAGRSVASATPTQR